MKIETVLSTIFAIFIVCVILSAFPNSCQERGCDKNALDDSKYCATHDRKYNKYKYKTYTNTYTNTYTSTTSKKSSTEKKKEATTTSTKGSSSTKKSSSSKKTTSSKKAKMPDCDDYDSYDDFMDDWDGCMPDGSDAEDYWENW